ncbi:MAG: DUF6600 domain-containing protein [Thermoanaerobaculales bacterium]
MKNKRDLMLIFAATALTLTLAAPQTDAGGRVGLRIGNMGFGLSVGYGDWGVYTDAWADPYWNLSYDAAFSGYGEWVWVSGLGRVWRPWVAGSWRPFTHGRWVYTNLGWTWVAYEPWGYVPHHYGQWAYSSYGWVWRPGYTYQAANVVWVGSGAYVGWYAAPPRGWSHATRGFLRGYDHGYRDGYRDAQYATYVPWRNMGADNISQHAVNRSVVSRGRIETLTTAPSTSDVLQRGGVRFAETRLSTRTVRTGGRQITVARPDGVTRSVERNAGPTAERVLSDAARVRRQPMTRTQSPPSSPSTSRSTARPARSGDTRSRSATGSRRETAFVQAPTRTAGVSADRRISEPQRSQPASSDRSVVRSRTEAQSPHQSTTSRRTAPASRRAATTNRSRAAAAQSSTRSRATHSRRATENSQRRAPSRQPAAHSRSSKDETEKEAPRTNRRSGRSRARKH